MVRKSVFGLVLALVAGSVGCHCCGERCPQRAVAAPPCCPPAGGVAVPAAPAPVAAPVPAAPPGAYYGP